MQVVDGVDGSGVASGFEKLAVARAPANVRIGGRWCGGGFADVGVSAVSGKMARWPPLPPRPAFAL